MHGFHFVVKTKFNHIYNFQGMTQIQYKLTQND